MQGHWALNTPQADYCPLGGRCLRSLVLPLLPLALAGEIVLGLGQVRFIGTDDLPQGGGEGGCLRAQSRNSRFQLFTAREIHTRTVCNGQQDLPGGASRRGLGRMPEVFTQSASSHSSSDMGSDPPQLLALLASGVHAWM